MCVKAGTAAGGEPLGPGGQRCSHRGQTSRTRLCLRYAEDTTLMAEKEEELKSLLRKVEEESEKLV